MGKTRFTTGDRKDIFLYNTTVENLFINEFLPDAPGDCVKVFLFGLMYAQIGEDIEPRTLALTLGMNEKDVENAWKYWDAQGLVHIQEDPEEGSSIEFVRQIDLFYGKTIEESYPVQEAASARSVYTADEGLPGAGADDDALPESGQDADDSADAIIARLINQQMREIFDKYQEKTGRTLSRHEAGKLTAAVKEYNIEPDVLDFAIDYCVDIDKYSVDYIFKVALRWAEEGCRDVAQVKVMLDKHSKRNEYYRKVFGALGFNRLPTPADREMMDRWIDEMGMSLREVLEGCNATAGIREPNLRYVNKVLENKMLEKGGVNTRQSQGASSQWAKPQTGGQQAPGGQAGQTSQTSSTAAAGTGSAMSDGLARVSKRVLKEYYDCIRSEEDKKRQSRIDEVSGRIPEIRKVQADIAELNRAVVSLTPGPDARANRQRLREQRRELEDEKRRLLIRSGYPEDYLERRYRCQKCKDTGYTDEGRVCTCCKERAEEAYRWIQETGNR